MESQEKLRKIAGGAMLMAFAYFASRLLGLVREMSIAWRFGATTATDLYNAAFLVPDILNHLVAGGAFSIVLIPMLSRHLQGEDIPRINEQGNAIFSRIFFPMAATVIGLTALLLLLAPPISRLLYPRFIHQPSEFALLVRLTRIVLPAQVFFLVGGLYNAVLRTCGDFRGNAWTPILYNLGIIGGAVLLSPMLGIAGVSVGALAGAFVGAFLLVYLLSRPRFRQHASWKFWTPEFREYLLLSLPLMLGFSLLTLDQWFVRFFGTKPGIGAGTLTCLNYARAIMLVPIGILGQSVGMASLTYLSQLWQQGKEAEYRDTFRETLRSVLFLSILFAGLLFLLARPLIFLLFRHGAFTAAKSALTADFLRIMVLAIPVFSMQQTLVNGYYAKKNTLRPMIVSTLVSAVSFGVYWLLQRQMGGTGIAVATAVCFWLLLFVMLADYQRRYGRAEGLNLAPIFITAFKGAAVSIAAILTTNAASSLLPFAAMPARPAGRLPSLVGAIAVQSLLFLAVAAGLTLLLGGAEAGVLRGFTRRLLRRRASSR